MKILICAESFYPEINGVSSVLTNLTRELSKKNISISVATKKIPNRKNLIIKKKKILFMNLIFLVIQLKDLKAIKLST